MTADVAYKAYVSGIPNIKAQIEAALKAGLVTPHYINPNPSGKQRKLNAGFMAFLTANKLITDVPSTRGGGFGGGEVSTYIDGDKELAPLKAQLTALADKFGAACKAKKLNLDVQIAYKRNDTSLTVDNKPQAK